MSSSSSSSSSFRSGDTITAAELWRTRDFSTSFVPGSESSVRPLRTPSSGTPVGLAGPQKTGLVPSQFGPSASGSNTRLQTGFAANAAADDIARKAWQPAAQDRAPAMDGRPGYTDLTKALEQARADGRPVIATYGEIIFLGSSTASRAQQERDVASAIREMESSPTGKKLLKDLAAAKGLPIVVQINNNRDNNADIAENSGLARKAANGNLNPLNARNFDLINWDSNTGFRSKLGGAPPWIVLAHELKHAQQFEKEREKSASSRNPDGRITNPGNLNVDKNGDGVPDSEAEAVSLENRILRQIGLSPIRITYNDPVEAMEVANAASIPRRSRVA